MTSHAYSTCLVSESFFSLYRLTAAVSLDHISHGLLDGKVFSPLGGAYSFHLRREGTSDPHQDPFAKGSGGDLHGCWSQDRGSVAFGVQRPLCTQCCLGQRRREMGKWWSWSQNLCFPVEVATPICWCLHRNSDTSGTCPGLYLPPSVTRFAQSGRSL